MPDERRSLFARRSPSTWPAKGVPGRRPVAFAAQTPGRRSLERMSARPSGASSGLRTVGGLIALLAIAAIVGVLIFETLRGVHLQAGVLGVHQSGAHQVTVSWRIRNTGSSPAYFRHCTVTASGAGGQSLGSTTGGPFPSQESVGPISPGGTWKTTTLVTVSGSATLVGTATVTCTGTVNAGRGG